MPQIRPQILFLPRWYPHRYDSMPGLFIQRQAEAVSAYCDVVVLYVHEDIHCPNAFEVDISDEGKVKVVRVYYRIRSKDSPFPGRAIKLFRFLKAYWLGFRVFSTFVPDLLHVHVLTRTGVVAMIYGLLNRKPYLVSEHWSRYFPENGTYQGWLRKLLTSLVVRRARAIIPVSKKLMEAMLEYGLKNPEYHILPNSVDTGRFVLPGNRQPDRKIKLIHVSCFEDKSKNISGFLRVIKELSAARSDFEVTLVGAGPDFEECTKVAAELNLDGSVVNFTGQKETSELAKLMGDADFMVLSSNYETFGTVVVESLACGTPVVATNVGVVPEIINSTNGIIVPAGDEEALLAGIVEMMDVYASFDRKTVRNSVPAAFASEHIGKELCTIYCKILHLQTDRVC